MLEDFDATSIKKAQSRKGKVYRVLTLCLHSCTPSASLGPPGLLFPGHVRPHRAALRRLSLAAPRPGPNCGAARPPTQPGPIACCRGCHGGLAGPALESPTPPRPPPSPPGPARAPLAGLRLAWAPEPGAAPTAAGVLSKQTGPLSRSGDSATRRAAIATSALVALRAGLCHPGFAFLVSCSAVGAPLPPLSRYHFQYMVRLSSISTAACSAAVPGRNRNGLVPLICR